jgi:hypothetical protein
LSGTATHEVDCGDLIFQFRAGDCAGPHPALFLLFGTDAMFG